MWLTVGEAVQLACAEASQDGKFSLGVFVIDLDHTANEELFLLRGSGFPIVWLGNSHSKPLLAGPFLLLRLFLVLWD
jgi:hypothetical protein